MRLGIDTGGTFTDVMAVDDAGRMNVVKSPSTPDAPVNGPIGGIRALLAATGPAEISEIAHGTTVGINALLQRRTPPVGLITTRGFRSVLEIGRQSVPGQWGAVYRYVKPPRAVPFDSVVEVDERLDAAGAVLTPLDEDSVRVAADRLAGLGIATIAVCLLHAYLNPIHEQWVRDILLADRPDWLISLSSEVMPEFREYERSVTTAVNALLTPVVGRYLTDLEARVHAEVSPDAAVLVMRSAGGVVSAQEAAVRPLHTAMSGPAAGVLGMAAVADAAGYPNAITFDMGGTSTDVAAVEDGVPAITSETLIDVYPVRAPTLDLVSIGAGGGSIAWIGLGGRLRVGPQSAGAAPGPACYGTGGQDATVTDANLLLGRLPDTLLGGAFTLDRAAAEAALARIGDPEQTAYRILEVANSNMVGAIREVTIRRGRDPRDFALVGFGGAGPVHAARLAQLLEIPTVIIPPFPGLGSCIGLLVADMLLDASATLLQQEAAFDPQPIGDRFAAMEAGLRHRLANAGIDDPTLRRTVDLRYIGMGSEIAVPIDEGSVTRESLRASVERFHQAHESLFGYGYRGSHQVELVTLRVEGRGRRRGAPPIHVSEAAGQADRGSRRARIDDAFADVPVFWRPALAIDAEIHGPALIDQYDSTTVVPAGVTARTDAAGNLILMTR